MDFVYNDYANWRIDYQEFIDSLKESAIMVRFKHIYAVIEHIYNKAVDQEEVSFEEEEIFQYGFEYLFERFEMLSILFKENYESIEDMKRDAKNLNLLFYLLDFEKEAKSLDKETKEFQDLEQKVYEYIKKNEEVPEELYGEMNNLAFKTFVDEDYRGIVEIFLEIADEMGISYLEDSEYTI